MASENPGAFASGEQPRLVRQGSRVNLSSSARGGEAMASGSNWLSGECCAGDGLREPRFKGGD